MAITNPQNERDNLASLATELDSAASDPIRVREIANRLRNLPGDAPIGEVPNPLNQGTSNDPNVAAALQAQANRGKQPTNPVDVTTAQDPQHPDKDPTKRKEQKEHDPSVNPAPNPSRGATEDRKDKYSV